MIRKIFIISIICITLFSCTTNKNIKNSTVKVDKKNQKIKIEENDKVYSYIPKLDKQPEAYSEIVLQKAAVNKFPHFACEGVVASYVTFPPLGSAMGLYGLVDESIPGYKLSEFNRYYINSYKDKDASKTAFTEANTNRKICDGVSVSNITNYSTINSVATKEQIDLDYEYTIGTTSYSYLDNFVLKNYNITLLYKNIIITTEASTISRCLEMSYQVIDLINTSDI